MAKKQTSGNLALEQQRVIVIPAHDEIVARKLRVAAYARVSSSSEDQLNSYRVQNQYYSELISSNPDWEMVDIYADEGITGTSVEKREDFQRMMRDCRKGKIDRILVKSISRFARNTKDCLAAVRELKELGVSVQFEEQGIDTARVSSEMVTAIMASLAQKGSESISGNVQWGYQKRIQGNKFNTCKAPFGFRLRNGQLIIEENEAAVVRQIFDMFLHGNSREEIASALRMANAPTRKDVQVWAGSTVYHILRNERYAGNALLGKFYTTDTFPHRKMQNRGEREQRFFYDTNPAIVTMDVFERTQALLKQRDTRTNALSKERTYEKLLQCPRCGCSLKRKTSSGKEYWVCQKHFEDSQTCNLRPVPTGEIEQAFCRLYYKLKHHSEPIFTQMLSNIQKIRYSRMLWSEDVISLNKKISDILSQVQFLAQLQQAGGVDPDTFIAEDGRWTVRFGTRTAGIIIPAKSADGFVCGAQIRLDIPIREENAPADKEGTKYLWLSSSSKPMGTSSESPIHFVGDPCSRVVYVTEGLLKADICHALMNRTFAATAGANNVSKLDGLFAFLKKNGTEEIIEAQDMDKYRNVHVEKGASKIYLMARKHGLQCRRLTWNPNYKGLDDWQLALRKNAGKAPKTMTFREQYLYGVCEVSEIDACVERWHKAQPDGVPLQAYLGLLDEEYHAFLQPGGNAQLAELLNAQRKQLGCRIYQLEFTDTEKTKPFAFSGIDALHKAGFQQPPANEYRLVQDESVYVHNYYARCKRFDGILKVAVYMTEALAAGGKKPLCELFLDYDAQDFLTYSFEGKKWRTAMLHNLSWHGDGCYRIWISARDAAAICRYLHSDKDAVTAIQRFQDDIRKKQLRARHKKQTDPWDAAMALVPPLPKDWNRWVSKVGVIQNYMFYQYRHGGAKTGYCSYCDREVPIRKPKHNAMFRCPRCRKQVQFKALGKMGAVHTEPNFVYLIQPYPGGFVIREFWARRFYNDTHYQNKTAD